MIFDAGETRYTLGMPARIGIFGGTFDPPHLGHLILASEAYEQLDLERLLWVLTPGPPHKPDQPIAALEHRLEMLRRTIFDDSHFELSRVELDRAGPHYAVETVAILAQEYVGAELFYIMGGDSLRDLPTWHRPLDFVSVVHAVGVMRRPGEAISLEDLETVLPNITKKVVFIEAPLIGISSSEIRHHIAQGRTFRYYLPQGVYQYILDNSLYF